MEQDEDKRVPKDTQPAQRAGAFGRRLREARESYSERERAREQTAAGQDRRMTVGALLACMRRAGQPLSAAAYSEIENGLTLPRNAPGFIDAVAICLRLGEQEKRGLEVALAYDLVYARLGDRTQEAIGVLRATPPTPQRPSILGLVLAMCREQAGVTPVQLAECLLARRLQVKIPSGEDPVPWLAAQIERLDHASIYEPWPLSCPESEFVREAGECLSAALFATAQLDTARRIDKVLAGALGIDMIARHVNTTHTSTRAPSP